jgi:hypothetical protein
MSHFADYIKRVLVAPHQLNGSDVLERYGSQSADAGVSGPVFHSVRGISGAVRRVRPGDTIWWFSQLQWVGKRRLPPSLDARIEVAEVSDTGDGRMRFEAGPGSCWFPLWDADSLLHKLEVKSSDGAVSSLLVSPSQAAGQALRFMREVHDPGPLLKHTQAISNISHDFVSYRVDDGTELAFECVARLLDSGRSVFWDRWSLPRRLAEKGVHIDPIILESHIKTAIDQARVVWGVRSPSYGAEGTYSKLEMELAKSQGKLQHFPPLDD